LRLPLATLFIVGLLPELVNRPVRLEMTPMEVMQCFSPVGTSNQGLRETP
jgi:hypothetical protein